MSSFQCSLFFSPSAGASDLLCGFFISLIEEECGNSVKNGRRIKNARTSWHHHSTLFVMDGLDSSFRLFLLLCPVPCALVYVVFSVVPDPYPIAYASLITSPTYTCCFVFVIGESLSLCPVFWFLFCFFSCFPICVLLFLLLKSTSAFSSAFWSDSVPREARVPDSWCWTHNMCLKNHTRYRTNSGKYSQFA